VSRKPQPLKSIGSLLLVGAGKMGGAMLDGWIARGLAPTRIVVIEPQPGKALQALARRGLKLNPKGKIAAAAAAIVIAVKPQSAPDAVPPLRPYVGKTTLVLSIMAGRTLAFLENALPSGTAIVRAMPNTPASIGRGISVAVGNAKVSARQRKLAGHLLAAIGKVEWASDETLMDAVTALSGSGPAYVFLLAEAMTKAGTRRKSRELALQMLFQMEMGKQNPDQVRQSFWSERQDLDDKVRGFADDLFGIAAERAEEIDQLIERNAEHWRMDRMAAVDRNLLRAGVAEFLGFPETPRAVVINEALEIARRFSTPESVHFINGVLDSVARELGEGKSRAE